MRTLARLSVLVLLAGAALSAVQVVLAQDAVKALPANSKVLVDNDDVRVYEFWAKPGEKVAMHSHPRTVVYSLTDATATLTGADGKSQVSTFKAGQAIYHGPVTHKAENTGKTDIHFVVVEIKR
ncbi:MAG: hypothetical protein ACOY7U_09355 [Acidobacteriota bacterium]|jgi:quercetin dioxygenase-like cupin family protein|uniref:Cupin 2 conserved barrel domain-containing protein n=1 Tax=Thermoanaerobaculum aquaticum TaxID=1312852 RepID=A0A062XRC4_9BACT|nr:hypothetical protein [Thermoanaerobaculum aquaticum]KDA53368.1 hypothetical protein EG19_06355 [Thermoanaerobaculum aquaticum]BCW92614.1 MAG: hypothetical protein KatS3mg007_0508 [Thermoanaerobaculum sp.]GBC79134.1 hypothetical protein HRbin09_00348 [bacterium HR09]